MLIVRVQPVVHNQLYFIGWPILKGKTSAIQAHPMSASCVIAATSITNKSLNNLEVLP